jgi:uncharacterized protein (TIGR03435 family)
MSAFPLAANHLWQSTLLAAAAALVALALRRHGAQVRYWVWLAASVKFLVPFGALVAIGGAVSWRSVDVVPYENPVVLLEAISDPFSPGGLPMTAAAGDRAAASLVPWLPVLATAVWALGAAIVLTAWLVRWRRMRWSLRQAVPLTSGREVESLRRLATRLGVRPPPMRESEVPVEPGACGILRPVLLWPRGISDRLTDDQVDAILAHELCHVRRRDNLAAALHMASQAIFWFHPLVWWIGARLVDERERACDEEVIRLGSEPEVYAESILKTCTFYLESPLVCVAGVTGSDLKKRIEHIMTHGTARTLGVWRKTLLGLAGAVAFVTPVAFGAFNPPPQTRAVAAPATLPAFDEISIRPNASAGRGGRGGQMQPGRFVAQNLTLRTIIRRAFGGGGRAPGNTLDLFESQVAGGPDWLDRDKFDIVATAAAAAQAPEMRLMLQRMLADRFELAAHWETRELPVYLLTRARGDGRLGAGLTPISDEECAAARGRGGLMPPPAGTPAQRLPCGAIQFGPGQLSGRAPIDWLASTLTNVPVVTGIDRMVLDRTGMSGTFGFALTFAAAASISPDPDRPELLTALQEQLGLTLEPARAPVDVVVIDRVERPQPN